MKRTSVLLTIALAVLLVPAIARAHCDTLAGPVITDARFALNKGDVTPVLKWVRPEDEAELRAVFQKASIVRAKGADAKEIADRYFFETLVRLHRAGEGASFTGLKNEPPEASVAVADGALQSGSADELVNQTTAQVAAGLRQRFSTVSEARKHAGESVSSGREYVARYVEFIHYVEGLNALAAEHTESKSIPAHRD